MKRGFHAIMAAQFFSSLADNALLIAAIAMLAQLDGPPWLTPLLKFFFTISYVVLAFLVGAFADSMPKGRVMFITNSIKIVGCGLILFNEFLRVGHLPAYWLVLIAYIVLMVAIGIGLHLVGASMSARLLVAFLIALLIGFEAASLRRWTLARRGWNDVGLVVADDVESAERRFFDAWAADGGHRVALPIAPAPVARTSGAPPDVIGLFPEPGGRA